MSHYFLLVLVALILSAGNTLLKLGANNITKDEGTVALILSVANPFLIVAVIVYVGGTALWIYMLSLVPLSRAYPFMSLTFVIIPVISYLFLGETIGWRYLLGVTVIIAGLLIITYDATA